MEVFKILSYDPYVMCHRVEDRQGKKRLVDVMINGDFPEGTNPDELVGKTVACDYDYPYITIAMRVQEIKNPAAAIGHDGACPGNATVKP